MRGILMLSQTIEFLMDYVDGLPAQLVDLGAIPLLVQRLSHEIQLQEADTSTQKVQFVRAFYSYYLHMRQYQCQCI
jgi:hypothetical protein